MALTIEQEAQQPTGTAGANGSHAGEEFPTPYLGRSVNIVGQHVNVDMNQSPHPKNQRGELGKPLFNWYRNTVSKDPLTRVSAPNHFADRRHFLTNVINRSSNGKVNPQKVAVDDPAAMTRHIKAVAHYMGADVVGIAKAHPSYLYAGGAATSKTARRRTLTRSNSPEELARQVSLYHPGDHGVGLQQAPGAPPSHRRRRVPRLANERRDGAEGARRLHQRTGLHGAPRRSNSAGRRRRRGHRRAGPKRPGHQQEFRRPHSYARPDLDRPAAGCRRSPWISASRTSARSAANAPTPVRPTASRSATRWSTTASKNTRSIGSLATSCDPTCTIIGAAASPAPPSARSPNRMSGGTR